MKINIKNLLFQPLALHLAADGGGLHLSARECKEILTEQISEEIERAAARGIVSLIGRAAAKADRVTGDGSSDAPSKTVAPLIEPQAKQRKGKVR